MGNLGLDTKVLLDLDNDIKSAEQQEQSNPSYAIRGLRTVGEIITVEIARINNISFSDCKNQQDKLYKLKNKNLLPEHIFLKLDDLRFYGNKASHNRVGTREKAKMLIRYCYELREWLRKECLASQPVLNRQFSDTTANVYNPRNSRLTYNNYTKPKTTPLKSSKQQFMDIKNKVKNRVSNYSSPDPKPAYVEADILKIERKQESIRDSRASLVNFFNRYLELRRNQGIYIKFEDMDYAYDVFETLEEYKNRLEEKGLICLGTVKTDLIDGTAQKTFLTLDLKNGVQADLGKINKFYMDSKYPIGENKEAYKWHGKINVIGKDLFINLESMVVEVNEKLVPLKYIALEKFSTETETDYSGRMGELSDVPVGRAGISEDNNSKFYHLDMIFDEYDNLNIPEVQAFLVDKEDAAGANKNECLRVYGKISSINGEPYLDINSLYIFVNNQRVDITSLAFNRFNHENQGDFKKRIDNLGMIYLGRAKISSKVDSELYNNALLNVNIDPVITQNVKLDAIKEFSIGVEEAAKLNSDKSYEIYSRFKAGGYYAYCDIESVYVIDGKDVIKADVLSLECQPYETIENYKSRIKNHKPILIGNSYINYENYDDRTETLYFNPEFKRDNIKIQYPDFSMLSMDQTTLLNNFEEKKSYSIYSCLELRGMEIFSPLSQNKAFIKNSDFIFESFYLRLPEESMKLQLFRDKAVTKTIWIGKGTLIKDNGRDRYDINTGYFPMEANFKGWFENIFNYKGFYTVLKRDEARSTYNESSTYNLYGTFSLNGEGADLVVRDIVLDNIKKIPVNSKNPENFRTSWLQSVLGSEKIEEAIECTEEIELKGFQHDKGKTIELISKKAEDLLKNKNYKESINYFGILDKLNKKNGDMLIQIGDTFYGAKDYKHACLFYEKAYEFKGDNTNALKMKWLADVYGKTNEDEPSAVHALLKSKAVDLTVQEKKSLETLFVRKADLYRRKSDYKSALEYYKLVFLLNDGNVPSDIKNEIMGIANLLQNSINWEYAPKYYSLAVKDYNFLKDKGLSCFRNTQFKRAILYLIQAAKLNNDVVKVIEVKLMELIQRGLMEDAELYNKALLENNFYYTDWRILQCIELHGKDWVKNFYNMKLVNDKTINNKKAEPIHQQRVETIKPNVDTEENSILNKVRKLFK